MTTINKYNNQKGFALILALSMLAILSILGVFALNTSTTEVQISGNYSGAQQAFFAADRIIATADTEFAPGGKFFDMQLDEVRPLDGNFLTRSGNSGLVPGTSSVRLAYVDSIHSYYVVDLTGGVFATADSAEPRQRVRIITKRALEIIPDIVGSGEMKTID